MNREVRGIITGLNVAVSILVTQLLARYAFGDIRGFRLFIVVVAVSICLYKALSDGEAYIIQRGVRKRNEEKYGRSEKSGDKNIIQGIPWYEMRYPQTGKRDRDR